MNDLKISMSTAEYAVFTYLLLLPLSLICAAYIWTEKVSGVLYVCTDSLGIFDFMPPFVHPMTDDLWKVPVWHVYLLWYVMLAGVLLLPALIMSCLWIQWKKDSQKF